MHESDGKKSNFSVPCMLSKPLFIGCIKQRKKRERSTPTFDFSLATQNVYSPRASTKKTDPNISVRHRVVRTSDWCPCPVRFRIGEARLQHRVEAS